MTKKTAYSEPAEYFPKSIRKACKIGEFTETSKKRSKKTQKKEEGKKKREK